MDFMAKQIKLHTRGKDDKTFGQRLRSLRVEQGLTQPELGDLIGVSSRALCSYEKDQREPPSHILPEIAKHLGISLDELMGLSVLKKKSEPSISRRWFRKFEQIEKLTDRKQRAIMQVLDMALKST